MPDYFAALWRGPRPPKPDGFTEWEGYRLAPGHRFHRTDLLGIAAANGYRVSPELLHKWRVWRFLPSPIPGGSDGHGPGKRQTWSRTAAWRVAWMSRWMNDRLTYDILRLAIWPRNPMFEQQRAADVAKSIKLFLAQDERFHDAVLVMHGHSRDSALWAYEGILMAESPTEAERRLVLQKLAPNGGASDEVALERLRRASFDAMHETLDNVLPDILPDFIRGFRAATHKEHRQLSDTFWKNPPDLARTIVGALHTYVREDKSRRLPRGNQR